MENIIPTKFLAYIYLSKNVIAKNQILIIMHFIIKSIYNF